MKTIAIIGASQNREKFGNKAVRAYQDEGWQVYPINPRGGEIEDLKVFKSILDIPGKIDRVSIYLPPEIGIHVLSEVALKKANEVYLNPGSESKELINKAKELGLDPILACSIVAVNRQPKDYH
ncbi:CoA-binding protein [Patescibacteria group bacterium]|nr:CoA-binding protein [Patescibacteria group bacterium]MBU0964217.1 CoA-binding protein [Patescibacteria group bacterium]